MKQLIFKAKIGFGEEDYIDVYDDELYTAMTAWNDKKRYTGRGGVTNIIMAIIPDFGRIMGHHRGYKMSAADYFDLEHIGADKKALARIAEVQRKINKEPPTKAIGESDQEEIFVIRNTCKELDIVNIENAKTGVKKVVSYEEAGLLKEQGLLVERRELK